jgi:CBS domain-containing protein
MRLTESGTMLSTVCEAPISEVFPRLLQTARPTGDGASPLIAAGSTLAAGEMHMLPLTNGISPRWDEQNGLVLYAALGGYALIRRILETKPSEHYKVLWSPCKETVVWLGTCMDSDSLNKLLEVFSLTRFGNARVEWSGSATFATLADVLELLRAGTLRTDISLAEVGSTMVEIDPQASVREAASTMVEHGVRRVFVKGRGAEFVSSRSILRHLFSAERLFLARDNPEAWLGGSVSGVTCSTAPLLSRGETARDAARTMGNLPDDCVLTDDGKVVSRWDLLVKPWKAGRLS